MNANHGGLLSPNPPRTSKDTDGRREDSGRWVRELQGRWPGLHWGRWKVGGRLKPSHSAPMAVCASCGARDGERIRSRELPRTGLVRVAGTFGWSLGGSVAGWPSGREWNGSQPGHGASELGFPRPALGEMQGEAARRAGDPSHQGEDSSPEGLGGHGWFAQTNPRRPAVQVMRDHLDRQPGALRQAQDWR